MGLFGNIRRILGIPARRWIHSCDTGADYKPKHLICFKQWTADMIFDCINSAIRLKQQCPDTHMQKLEILKNAKILILEEINEPFLFAAVSKAATFLGADDFGIIDKVLWDSDYNGRIFSSISDAIFVSTITHLGVQRMAEQSTVPVMCVKSRTHASLQGLAIVMAVVENFGRMQNINFGYIGPPRQILNSLLLLCPMLGANIRFMCSCPTEKQSPLLLKLSTDVVKEMGGSQSTVVECANKETLLKNVNVVIAGPTIDKQEKVKFFALEMEEINKFSNDWVFIHCCPRGKEVADTLFHAPCALTYTVFHNMQYIAASLMANAIMDHAF